MMKLSLMLILCFLAISFQAQADVAASYIEMTCNAEANQISLVYSYDPAPPKIGTEHVYFHNDLISPNGLGWAPKTITRQCNSLKGDTFVVAITGKPLNADNAQGTCGEVFAAEVEITQGDHNGLTGKFSYFQGDLNGLAGSEGVCVTTSATINKIVFDMLTDQTTITPTPIE
jgi:hypothetical protein